MTMHSLHPDTHTHGLADDCPRCEEHAADPVVGLDQENLARIVQLAVHRDVVPLSYMDQVAAASALNILERAGHMYRTAPDEVAEFFSRYGIRVAS